MKPRPAILSVSLPTTRLPRDDSHGIPALVPDGVRPGRISILVVTHHRRRNRWQRFATVIAAWATNRTAQKLRLLVRRRCRLKTFPSARHGVDHVAWDRLGHALDALRTLDPDRAIHALGPIKTLDPLRPFLQPFVRPIRTIRAIWALLAVAVHSFGSLGPVLKRSTRLALPIAVLRPLVLPAVRIVLARITLRAAVEPLRDGTNARLRLIAYARKRLSALAAGIIAIILAKTVTGFQRVTGHHLPIARRHAARIAALGDLLLAVGQNDAIIVLSVLQIILCEYGVARRLSIARQSHVLLGYVGRGAAQFDVRPIALKAAGGRVLAFSVAILMAVIVVVIVAIRVAAATSAVLLSLPHGLPFFGGCYEIIAVRTCLRTRR